MGHKKYIKSIIKIFSKGISFIREKAKSTDGL